MQYVSAGVPVMFTSNPVQQRRWQEFLEHFTLGSVMPDIMNVKYLVYGRDQYQKELGELTQKYLPAFITPDGGTVVLENRTVLPKAWLVPATVMVHSAEETLRILQNPAFDPRLIALVESASPIRMAELNVPVTVRPGEVRVLRYEGERIDLEAEVAANSMLVLGEKYYQGWRARVDGKQTEIYPVDHVLRGIYLTPGRHKVEFVFDPTPFKVGKCLTLGSFAFFALMLVREMLLKRQRFAPRK